MTMKTSWRHIGQLTLGDAQVPQRVPEVAELLGVEAGKFLRVREQRSHLGMRAAHVIIWVEGAEFLKGNVS